MTMQATQAPLTMDSVRKALREYDCEIGPAFDARARMSCLRTGLQLLSGWMQDAKAAGRVADQSVIKAAASRLMLDYVGNGYVTRVWHEIEGRP